MTKKKDKTKPVKSHLRLKVVEYQDKLYFQLDNLFLDRLDVHHLNDFCQKAKITVLRNRKTFARLEFQELEFDRGSSCVFSEPYAWRVMPFESERYSEALYPKWFKPGDVLSFSYITNDAIIFSHRIIPKEITPQEAAAYLISHYANYLLMTKVEEPLIDLILGNRKKVDFNALIGAYIQKAAYQGKEFWIINFSKLD